MCFNIKIALRSYGLWTFKDGNDVQNYGAKEHSSTIILSYIKFFKFILMFFMLDKTVLIN